MGRINVDVLSSPNADDLQGLVNNQPLSVATRMNFDTRVRSRCANSVADGHVLPATILGHDDTCSIGRRDLYWGVNGYKSSRFLRQLLPHLLFEMPYSI